MKTWFLVFILCISISKLIISSIMFSHARHVKTEPDDSKKLKEIEEILSGTPMSIANQILSVLMVLFLIGGIFDNLRNLHARGTN